MYIEEVTNQSFSVVMESLTVIADEYHTHIKATNDLQYVLENFGRDDLTTYQQEKLSQKMVSTGFSNVEVQEGSNGSGGVFSFIWRMIKGVVKVVLTPFVMIGRLVKSVANWLFGNKERIEKRTANVDKGFSSLKNEIAEVKQTSVNANTKADKINKTAEDVSQKMDTLFTPSKVDNVIDAVAKEDNGLEKAENALLKLHTEKPKAEEKPKPKEEAPKLERKQNNIRSNPEFLKFLEGRKAPFEDNDETLSQRDREKLKDAPINLSIGDLTAGEAFWMDELHIKHDPSADMYRVFSITHGEAKNFVVGAQVKLINYNLRRLQIAFDFINKYAKSPEDLAKIDPIDIVAATLEFMSPPVPSNIGIFSMKKMTDEVFERNDSRFANRGIDKKYLKMEMYATIPPSHSALSITNQLEDGITFPIAYYYHFPEIDTLRNRSKLEEAIKAHRESTKREDKSGKYTSEEINLFHFVKGLTSICDPADTYDIKPLATSKQYKGPFRIRAREIQGLNENGKGKGDERSIRRAIDLILNSNFNKDTIHKLQDEITETERVVRGINDKYNEEKIKQGNLGINCLLMLNLIGQTRDMVVATLHHGTFLLGVADKCNRFLELALLRHKSYFEKAQNVTTNKEAIILWYKFAQ